jgi:hypothetical protein
VSATIRLSRVGGFGPGSLRPLQVLVDGKKVADIKLGETKSITVAPGNRRVQVKQDFCASDPVSLRLEDNVTQAMECGCFIAPPLFFFIPFWAWRTFVPGKLFYLKRKAGR